MKLSAAPTRNEFVSRLHHRPSIDFCPRQRERRQLEIQYCDQMNDTPELTQRLLRVGEQLIKPRVRFCWGLYCPELSVNLKRATQCEPSAIVVREC